MAVVGAMNVYEDLEWLEASLPALRILVDRLIVVDGRYAAFPGGSPWSEDGTIEFARVHADEVVIPSDPWEDEVVKRNRYLERLDEGDWILVVDADEITRGTLNRDLLDERIGWNIDMENVGANGLKGTAFGVFRLVRFLPGLHYRGCHHCLTVGERILNHEMNEVGSIPGLTLEHHTDTRGAERQARKDKYYLWLRDHERDFRIESGLMPKRYAEMRKAG